MMKKGITNSGITLIALVVTIIVLLILAGVTISLVVGNNGIVGKANEADKQQTHASVKDQISLRVLDLSAENSIEQSMISLKEYLIDKGEANFVNGILELNANSLLGTNAKYGNGSNKSDVYTIESNMLYYYDKNGNKEKLEDLQLQEVIEEPTDESYFDFDEATGTISIKDTDSYYYYDEVKYKDAPIDTYVIPATYQGKEVIKVGHFNAPNIKKVVIQDGPSEIEANAFYSCTNLQEVRLPTTIESLESTFRNCTSLKIITIPKGIKFLASTFGGCTALSNITIPEGVEQLYSTFEGCTALTNVNLQTGPKELDSTFIYCTSLKTITIPEGVETLNNTFTDCTNLVTINLPTTLNKFREGAFKGCTGMKSIVIPTTITDIIIFSYGNSPFENWISEQTIYCEAESKPSGWDSNWNKNCNANIVWGYKK